MKFFIATIVAMNVGAQELSSTPIYTPDYSGIDNSSVGELIRKIAGSDNKKIIKDNLIVLFDSEKLELNKNNYANLKKLGFDCDQERCKYIANFYSKINSVNWSQSARTTYVISIPDINNINKIEVEVTQSTIDPQQLGSGKVAQFLYRWPPFKNEEELQISFSNFINDNLHDVKSKYIKLESLGFSCRDQCFYKGVLKIETVRDYKKIDESYEYELTVSIDGKYIYSKVNLIKSEE